MKMNLMSIQHTKYAPPTFSFRPVIPQNLHHVQYEIQPSLCTRVRCMQMNKLLMNIQHIKESPPIFSCQAIYISSIMLTISDKRLVCMQMKKSLMKIKKC